MTGLDNHCSPSLDYTLLVFPRSSIYSAFQFIRKFCLLVVVIVGLLYSTAFAQQGNWQYVTTIHEGIKFYLGKDRRAATDGNVLVWEKIMAPDNSFVASFVEWDCRAKMRRTHQSTFYNSDDTVSRTTTPLEWKLVIPGSSADWLMDLACKSAPPPVIAEITVPNAQLRAAPLASASVKQVAQRGTKFRVIPQTGYGGWFNLVELSKGEEDYWLTDDSFRIVTSRPAAGEGATSAENRSVVRPASKPSSRKMKAKKRY